MYTFLVIFIIFLQSTSASMAMTRALAIAHTHSQERLHTTTATQQHVLQKKQQFLDTVKQTSDVNTRLKNSQSLLMLAVETAHAEAVELLLIRGADLKQINDRHNDDDIYVTNSQKQTALTIAKLHLSTIDDAMNPEDKAQRKHIVTLLEYQIQLRQKISEEAIKWTSVKFLSNIIFEYSYGAWHDKKVCLCIIS